MKLTIKKPLITVIIPNYNHELFLKQRLDSVFDQTYQDYEVILLDDASTDDSIKLLSKYKEHSKVSHFIVNKENSGSPFKQWQKGIELAKGDYIWIAESDDYCELNFLEIIFKKLNPSCGICYAQSTDVDQFGNKIFDRINYTEIFNPNIWASNFSIEGEVFVNSYMSVKNVIPNASAVVFKKQLVNENIFNLEFLNMKMCGDWLFWIKLSLQTEVCFINEKCNFFRNHSNVSRNHNSSLKMKRRLLEESIIRSFLKKNNITNVSQELILYKKWLKLFTFKQFFSKEFKTIKLVQTSYLKFWVFVLKLKMKQGGEAYFNQLLNKTQ